MTGRHSPRVLVTGLCIGAVLIAAAGLGLDRLDRTYPPVIAAEPLVSTEIVDRNGRLLRPFALPDGRWRLAVSLAEVDERFLRMLIAYEDRRFWSHRGVDPLAIGRATLQWLTSGRIVSGASTITMQLARLSEPDIGRSLSGKLRQMLRALQIERRLTKDEILERYLTLAPYGGNIEGIRAATLTWFGKEPLRLSPAEAAFMVALPQSPETRRPDRHREVAQTARDRVLARMAEAGVLAPSDAARALAEQVPTIRHAMPALAAHAAEKLAAEPGPFRRTLAIDRSIQEALEAVARETAASLPAPLSLALVLAEAGTGEVLGAVGSPDPLDDRRSGWIDMTRAVRSPGSALKPFIYGLAFEEGLIAQETLIEDRPSDFSGYRPRNFELDYQGEVTIREALQLSLNVPAVALLESVGPARLTTRLRAAGVDLSLPQGKAPGLAIALGGAGLSLRDLVQLYTALSTGGEASMLSDEPAREQISARLFEPAAAWQVADILFGVAPPANAPALGIAYKTGTSYGYRDAWAIGFDGRHVLGVWVGRPDGGWSSGLSGYRTAAPILFSAFARSGLARVPLGAPPPGVARTPRDLLPVTQRRFREPHRLSLKQAPEPAPQIVFPPDGAHVDLGLGEGKPQSLALKLQGGRAPFRLLANGRPQPEPARRRSLAWEPDSSGFSTLTVIDAAGRAASVRIFVD